MNPIQFDGRIRKYSVWVSWVGIEYMKYFDTAAQASAYIKENFRKCVYVKIEPDSQDLNAWINDLQIQIEASLAKEMDRQKGSMFDDKSYNTYLMCIFALLALAFVFQLLALSFGAPINMVSSFLVVAYFISTSYAFKLLNRYIGFHWSLKIAFILFQFIVWFVLAAYMFGSGNFGNSILFMLCILASISIVMRKIQKSSVN